MRLRGLKLYRCGEPGTKHAPPKKIADLMVKHLGPHARIYPGGEYPSIPDALAKLLIADKAAEEF